MVRGAGCREPNPRLRRREKNVLDIPLYRPGHNASYPPKRYTRLRNLRYADVTPITDQKRGFGVIFHRRIEGKLTMHQWNSPIRSPYLFLILGGISFIAAVASTCMGKSWGRFGGVVYRAEEPSQFWWLVATYFLIGICFIGYFLYSVT